MQLLIDVLKLSTMFLIPEFRVWAIHYLNELPSIEFTPAIRFHCATTHRVLAWLEPSFRALVFMPLTELTYDNAKMIGLDHYHRIVNVRELVEQSRRLMCCAFPPTQCATTCTTREDCRTSWAYAWYSQFAANVFHPDPIFALKTQDEMEVFLQTMKIDGMGSICHDLTIHSVSTNPTFLMVEKSFTNALAQLKLDCDVASWATL
jgi:hypothetical protein